MGLWVRDSTATNITEFEVECKKLEEIWSKQVIKIEGTFKEEIRRIEQDYGESKLRFLLAFLSHAFR